MPQKKRCLMLGAGSMASNWVKRFFPNFADRVEVTAIVDVDRSSLDRLADAISLPKERRFTDMAAAFQSVDADFCAIVIPPAFHKAAVMHAVERRLPILSEKPIADTWESCLDVYRAVVAADLKMEVIQNYRYEAPILTMRKVVSDGLLGRVNYVIGRFADDYRKYGSWGAVFRHEIPHGLLVEGGIHHLDMIRNLSGGDCQSIAGWEWNPAWSESKGEFCDLYVLKMTNGVHASYEGSGTSAGEHNSWHQEYYRIECEDGAISVDRDRVVRIHRKKPRSGLVTEEVPLIKPRYEGHNWLIDEFLTWLAGGPAPATTVTDNIQSVAMLFGAIEASNSGKVVDVQAMINQPNDRPVS